MSETVIEGVPVAEQDQAGTLVVSPPPPAPVAPLPVPATGTALQARMDVAELVARFAAVKAAMEQVMQEGVHYGTVAGISKPTLLKPGAEVLAVLFQLAPRYTKVDRYGPGDHYHVDVLCTLWHQPTGTLVAEGLGSCTTREKKYGYRTAKRQCPACGREDLMKSRFAPKEGDYQGASPSDPPGWYCNARRGGCGANFRHDDVRVTGQELGTVENPDLPDQWNTVLKMGCKRAFIAGILNATGASALFTQDVEDSADGGHAVDPDSGQAADPFTSGQVPSVQRDTSAAGREAAQQPTQAAQPQQVPERPTDEDGGELHKPTDYLRTMLAEFGGWNITDMARVACDHVHGPAPSISARTLPQAYDIAQRLYRVLKYLRSNDSDLGFNATEMAAVWATCFDGAAVQPVYTASATEQQRAAEGAAIVDGLREQGALVPASELAAQGAAAGEAAAPDGGAPGPQQVPGQGALLANPDEIPFGEDSPAA